LSHFAQVADPTQYVPLPDDWHIGASDVLESTAAIAAGRYKAVNLAGAATVSAVANALQGDLPLFAFGGDGARFAVSPDQVDVASDALSRAAAWAARDLGLELRVGMTRVTEARASGYDVRVAFWQVSDHLRYAMFTGGGLEWVDARLKAGAIALPPTAAGHEPDLTGLSCQWGSIVPKQGKILSLIVKQAPGIPDARFAELATRVIALLEQAACLNPVPEDGPDVRWPSGAIALQSRVARQGKSAWRRRLHVLAGAALAWVLFKVGLRIGGFDAKRYRREIALNTDFRKFDDALMMTVDCSPQILKRLRAMLDEAAAEGTIRFGMHVQDHALMTCVVPSVLSADHIHFVDGADGGYASAARQLRDR
jgi:hypothetical protein